MTVEMINAFLTSLAFFSIIAGGFFAGISFRKESVEMLFVAVMLIAIGAFTLINI